MSLTAEYVKTLGDDLKPVAFRLLAEEPNLSFRQLNMLVKYYEASVLPTLKELNALKKEHGIFEEERVWISDELVEQLEAQKSLSKRLDDDDLSLEEFQAHNKRWEPKLYKFIEDYKAGLI